MLTSAQTSLPYGELRSLAAEYGIDWDKAESLITWDNDWKNDVPTISKSYQGRSSMISERHPNGRLQITFKTEKDGGKHTTWLSDKELRLPNNPLLERKRLQAKSKANRKAKAKAYFNEQYISQWKHSSKIVSDDFPYLKRKKINDANLKVLTERKGRKFLAIPLINRGQIVGLQRIYEDGSKRHTPGAKTSGSYYIIGSPVFDENTKIYITTGWATGKIIHTLTNCPVVCAFSDKNLPKIVETFVNKVGTKNIVVAVDNDQFKQLEGKGNSGMLTGLDINYNLKVKIRFPNFKGFEIGSKPTDFADLYLIAGPEETLKQLTKSRKSTLRTVPTALDSRLNKLSYCPKITSPNNKLLRSTVSQAIKKGCNNDEILDLIISKNPLIPEMVIIKAISKVRSGVLRRVKKCHLINPKKHTTTQFINLPLSRQDHGGYLIDSNFYEQIKDFEGIVIIKAPMGSGKTEHVIEKSLQNANKACYITHRISLTEEGSQRLKIDSYRNVSELDMYGVNKIGCCVNSLNNPKFGKGDWFLDCDVVAIDEGTKVLAHLSGGTVDDPEMVTNTLLCAIQSSKQVIICDADANDNLVEIFSQLTDKKVLVAQSLPRMDHINVTMTDLWYAFSTLFDEAKKGKKILCACDSKSDVNKVKKELDKSGLKVLGIHAETKILPEVERWIKNPSEESKNWDVVVYNSTIDSGVSVVTKHFDLQIGIFRGIISPQTVIQMMGRNRTSRDWLLGCSPIVSTRHGQTYDQKYKALAAGAMKVQWENNDVVQFPQLTSFDKIKLRMAVEGVRGKQDFFLTLATILDQKGYQITVKKSEDELVKELRKELKILGDEIKEKFVSLILDSKTPQPHRYRQLKMAYAISEDELAEIVRYEIRHNLGTYTISEEDIIFWLNNYDRSELWFDLLQTERDQLKAFDIWQAGKTESLTRRKHLVVKKDITNKLFETLNIDINTGEGQFNHHNCQKFIDYLYENRNRVENFNLYNIGPHLFDKKPADPTKFVKKCLEKYGLKTVNNLFGKDRLSIHSVDKASWQTMMSYFKKRQDMGLNIAKIPKENTLSEVHIADPEPSNGEEVCLPSLEGDDPHYHYKEFMKVINML